MNAFEVESRKISNHVPEKADRDVFPYHKTGATTFGRVRDTFGDEKLNFFRRNVVTGRVLDLGCSDGSTTREIAGVFLNQVQVVGVDIVTSDIQENIFARDIREPLFVQADGYFPPFPENSFDVIFMMNNLFYLLYKQKIHIDQMQYIFTNIFFILKSKSYFCLSGAVSDNGSLKKAYAVFHLDEDKKVSLWAKSDPQSFFQQSAYPEQTWNTVLTVFGATSPPRTPDK